MHMLSQSAIYLLVGSSLYKNVDGLSKKPHGFSKPDGVFSEDPYALCKKIACTLAIYPRMSIFLINRSFGF